MAKQGEHGISWTDDTWNPVRGCSLVSAGCKHCYAMKVAYRFSGPGMPYEGLAEMGPKGARWTGKVRLVPEHLADPLRWKKPRRIFVNSMSDLFHEGLSFEEIAAVFGVMAACPQHTFQVLTKRPERAAQFFRWASNGDATVESIGRIAAAISGLDLCDLSDGQPWPLPIVWLGVSAEDQKTADERIPHLLATPAAFRFVSYEPALGPVDFRFPGVTKRTKPEGFEAISPARQEEVIDAAARAEYMARLEIVDWVICGGESGHGARPMDVAWARSVVAQCHAAGVACFVKQLGARPFGELSGPWILRDRKGGDWSEWPSHLRVREFPQ
jgi:protein gp37